MLKKMNIYSGYISKQNSNHEKPIIPLMVPNRKTELSCSKRII